MMKSILACIALILLVATAAVSQEEQEVPVPPQVHKDASCGFEFSYPADFGLHEHGKECEFSIYEPWADTNMPFELVRLPFAAVARKNGFYLERGTWRIRSGRDANFSFTGDRISVWGLRGKAVPGEARLEEETVAVICDHKDKCLVMAGYVENPKVLSDMVASFRYFSPAATKSKR